MSKISVAYRWMYYLTIGIISAFAIMYLILFEVFIQTQDSYSIIFLSAFGAISIIFLWIQLRNLVFFEIDLTKKKVIIGSLFFKQVFDYKSVESIRKLRFSMDQYGLSINSKKFTFLFRPL